MTRKDPSPVDLETAEPEPVPRAGAVARRNLFARAGTAGLGGLVAALAVDRSVLAGVEDSVPRPNVPTESDIALLEQVIGFEIAASELYGARLDSGESGDLVTVVGVMAENHQAYAQAIAGGTGLSVKSADDEFFDANVTDFTGSDTAFLEAAHQLEQTAVATHISLIDRYESAESIALTASILVVEARHATVLADLLDVDDLAVIFGNDQSALTLSGTNP